MCLLSYIQKPPLALPLPVSESAITTHTPSTWGIHASFGGFGRERPSSYPLQMRVSPSGKAVASQATVFYFPLARSSLWGTIVRA